MAEAAAVVAAPEVEAEEGAGVAGAVEVAGQLLLTLLAPAQPPLPPLTIKYPTELSMLKLGV